MLQAPPIGTIGTILELSITNCKHSDCYNLFSKSGWLMEHRKWSKTRKRQGKNKRETRMMQGEAKEKKRRRHGPIREEYKGRVRHGQGKDEARSCSVMLLLYSPRFHMCWTVEGF